MNADFWLRKRMKPPGFVNEVNIVSGKERLLSEPGAWRLEL